MSNSDALVSNLKKSNDELTKWRRDLHAHPETAFEEVRTSDFVAEKLADFGLEVHRGLAKTGVVGTLRNGSSSRRIGLRADMDALDIQEANTFSHKSTIAGKMHGCGHDGHTTMLLGAARFLSENRNFDGIVDFIFQPAEENEGGGRAMIEDGLFDLFPVDAIFGLHNTPKLPIGTFAVRPGPMMAGFDKFDIDVRGVGGHAAFPEATIDPIVVSSHIITALQTIVSRSIAPMKSAVVSITSIAAGDTYNVIPDCAYISGCVRFFDLEVQKQVRTMIEQLVSSVANSFGATATVEYQPSYPPTVNDPSETQFATNVLVESFGTERVITQLDPSMGSEDFAYMLLEKPGCYILAGNGDAPGTCMVHSPNYDFNDEGIPWGVAYWVSLVEKKLSLTA